MSANESQSRNYDSEFCGSLPIHLINHIQPYGALLVINKRDLVIIQASENIESVLGKTAPAVVNTPLTNHVSPDVIDNVRARFSLEVRDKIPDIWTISGRPFLATEHLREDLLVVEFDLFEDRRHDSKMFIDVYKEIRYAMSRIQSSASINEIAEACANELKRISGFDKVMIYRFDKDWNGNVIAESMEPGMESYLGITFPASDIPQQARLLYQTNPYRFIPDRDYTPVKIFPVINPLTNTFVDLSDCNLRSVASVHIEYLKNMRVQASMSTRILCGKSLWGLIACHHRTPKHVDFEMRSIFEMLSNIVSAKITSLQAEEEHVLNIKTKEGYKSLVEFSYREKNLADALLNKQPNLLTLLNAEGAAISIDKKIFIQGLVPNREQLRELILWLHAKQLKKLYWTESLPTEYEAAGEFRETGSGLLVIPIDVENDEYAMIFRPEAVRVINWGGNPDDRIQFEPGSKNYHPRRSFEKWQQLVRGSSLPWQDAELSIAENLRSFIYEFTN